MNKTSTNGKLHLTFASLLQFLEVLFCLDLLHNGIEEKNIIMSVAHFIKYLMNAYYVPGTLLGARQAMVNKMDSAPVLLELPGQLCRQTVI